MEPSISAAIPIEPFQPGKMKTSTKQLLKGIVSYFEVKF